MAYGLGGVLFAWVAWRVPYWRHLLRAVHAPALLLPLYCLLVDESARWLHAAGRRADAVRVIRKAARWNKVFYRIRQESLSYADSHTNQVSLQKNIDERSSMFAEPIAGVGSYVKIIYLT